MSDDDRLRFPDDEEFDDEPAGWDGYLGPRVWFPVGLLGLAAVAFLGVLLALNWGGSGNSGEAGQPGGSLRQPVHWHADLALVVRDEAFDFAEADLLSTAERDLNPSAHIHDPRHTVVHIHLTHSTWGEFFEAHGFRISDSCVEFPDGEELCNTGDEQWTFVVNGVTIDTLRFQYIGDLDRVLLFYGPESEDEVLAKWEELVSDEACIPSGLCSARFPPGGIEEEPCSVGSAMCN